MTQGLPLIITRPLPGGEESLQRARDLGLDAHLIPLFAAHALDWTFDDAECFDSLLLTSAQAARLGGKQLADVRHLPCFAVGAATAMAARARGLDVVVVGETDGQQLVDTMTSNKAYGKQRILWLCGRDHTAIKPGTAQLVARPCYAVYPVAPHPSWKPLIATPAVLMAHSTRAAVHMAGLVGKSRNHLTLIAISRAVATAAGTGWHGCFAAEHPNDTAMLALACALCHKAQNRVVKE